MNVYKALSIINKEWKLVDRTEVDDEDIENVSIAVFEKITPLKPGVRDFVELAVGEDGIDVDHYRMYVNCGYVTPICVLSEDEYGYFSILAEEIWTSMKKHGAFMTKELVRITKDFFTD